MSKFAGLSLGRVLLTVAALVGLVACSTPEQDGTPGAAGPPPQGVDEPLPFELLDGGLAGVVPLGASDEYVVVSSQVEGDGEGLGTDVWLVTSAGARHIDRSDAPLMQPSGWVAGDGSVHVLGIDCDRYDADRGAMCSEAPMARLRIDGDRVERERLDMTLDAGTGFSLAVAGEQVAIMSFTQGDSGLQRQIHSIVGDAAPTDLGPSAPAVLCAEPDGVVVWPAEPVEQAADAPMPVRAIRDGRLVEIGPLTVPDIDGIAYCEPGDGAVALGPAGELLLELDGDEVAATPVGPRPPPTGWGSSAIVEGQPDLRWVTDDIPDDPALWELVAWSGSDWEPTGGVVESDHAPLLTEPSGDTALVITTHDRTLAVDLVTTG